MNSVITEALRLAALGYPVFPCHQDKTPMVSGGFKAATTKVATINNWFLDHPGCDYSQRNLAVPTAGLVVIDIDPVDGHTNHWPHAEQSYELTKARVAVQTPRGGHHIWYRLPVGKQWKCSQSKLAPGVDVKTDGGYVLVPPSKTADGEYTWMVDQELTEPISELTEPPEWLIVQLDAVNWSSDGRGGISNPQAAHRVCMKPQTKGGRVLLSKIPEGQRNSELASIAGIWRRAGLNKKMIYQGLMTENSIRCKPPLPDEEVKKIAESVARYKIKGHVIGGKIQEGGRNAELTSLAGVCRRQGMLEADIILELAGQNQRRCVPPLPVEEVRKIAASVARYKPTEDLIPMTDTGLAERFAKQHGDKVRYVWAWRKWLVWDGRRWKQDEGSMIQQLAKETIRSILGEAQGTEDDRFKKLCKFAASAESATRRQAMLDLARSEPGIPVEPEQLDNYPWLLNCQNGVIELNYHGECRLHDRHKMITKVVSVSYFPQADCPVWIQFLTEIFKGNANLVGFIQRLLGYCLTGKVTEQMLPIFYGVGANGKSTLINIMLELLGSDYSIKAPPDLLMLKQGTHPTERADLHGKRLVACIETDEGRRLAESLTKDLTGGDMIRARRMREDYWQFAPTHKIILACNHKPVIRGTDHALWRRVRLIPFDMIVPEEEQDRELPEKLRAELPGILAWCVRGCLDWQANGMAAPSEVKLATADYRKTEDTINTFLTECCTSNPDLNVKASALLEAFREWSGDKRFSQRRFGLVLTERGYTRYTNNGVWYSGLSLNL